MLLRVVDYKALMYFFGIMLLVTPVLADPWDKAVPVAHGLCQYFKTQVILPCLVMVEDGVRYLLIHKDGKPIEYLRNNEDGTQTTVWEEGKES
jgi:hypothetical protein